jgi:hypothetical protein
MFKVGDKVKFSKSYAAQHPNDYAKHGDKVFEVVESKIDDDVMKFLFPDSLSIYHEDYEVEIGEGYGIVSKDEIELA